MFSWKSHVKLLTLKRCPASRCQGPEHCSTLNFGLGSSDPVLGISGSELEAGVEYTFRLTISKDGMAPESTTQTVSVLTLRDSDPLKAHKQTTLEHREAFLFSLIFLFSRAWCLNLRARLIDLRFSDLWHFTPSPRSQRACLALSHLFCLLLLSVENTSSSGEVISHTVRLLSQCCLAFFNLWHSHCGGAAPVKHAAAVGVFALARLVDYVLG